MYKWDSISWWATGIFVLSLLITVLTKSDIYLLLMIGSYLLRPTLYALGVSTQNTDERLNLIQYRSGNLALTIVIISIIVLAVRNSIEGKPTDDFNFILIIALAARALSGVLLVGNYREAAVRISIGVGAFWLLFVGLENGLSLHFLLEGLPGFLFIGIGLLGRIKPLISAGIFAVLTFAALIMISFFAAPGFTVSQVMVALLVSIPLGAVSWCFFKSTKIQQPG